MNPLHTQQLSGTITCVALNERVRQRLREEKLARGISERDLAGMLGWSQSKIAYKLSGRTAITLDELDALCFALGVPPTEIVRDRGLEFCAEMTPTELRMLQSMRALPKVFHDAVMGLLRIQDIEARGATPRRSKVGKPRTGRV